MNDIINRIIEHRKSKGLTQKQMADYLGIGQVAYSQIETGKTEITLNRIFKISKILEVDLISLLFPDFDISHQLHIQEEIIKLLQKQNEIMESERKLLISQIRTQDDLINALLESNPELKSKIELQNEISKYLKNPNLKNLDKLYKFL